MEEEATTTSTTHNKQASPRGGGGEDPSSSSSATKEKQKASGGKEKTTSPREDKKEKKKTAGQQQQQQQDQLAYSLVDADGDGLVSLSDLEHVLKAVGHKMHRSELSTIARAVQDLTRQRLARTNDSKNGSSSAENGEEVLNWDDFTTLMSAPIEEEDIKNVWRILDSERKGQISVVDLTQVMEVLSGGTEKLTEEQINKLMEMAEVEDQLRIKYQHFKKWWQ